MADPIHELWKGGNKILLSIDIRITHSNVSFVYLENGAPPIFYSVTKWPGQEALDKESAVPTLAVAFGAEAQLHHIEEQAKDKGWFLAKNFKAHLYPEDTIPQLNLKPSTLPFGVSLKQVYSDFLGYLLKHAKSYFEDRIVDGVQIWESYKPTIEVIMSHPNVWGAREQSFLREVAVDAGYTTSDMAPCSIRFVTDVAAFIYACFFDTSSTRKLKTGDVLLLCDADATTTNISLHKVDSSDPVPDLKTWSSEHLEGGAASIDIAAERYMLQIMTNAGISPEDANEYTRAGVEDFKKSVKFAFSDETKDYLVEISNARFNNPTLKARRGRMVLPGSAVRSFFVDFIDIISRGVGGAINRLAAQTATNVSYILLAGRFGGIPYLERAIKELCRGYPIIAFASDSASRAVANGALKLDSMNSGFRPRRSFGIETSCGSWLQITTKGAAISPGTEIKKPVSLRYPTPHPELDDFELRFLSYTKEVEVLRTRDAKGVLLDGFSKWFTLTANLESLKEALVQNLGANNVVHWRLNFDVCVRFGEKGLETYLEWEENGGKRAIPATTWPDYDF